MSNGELSAEVTTRRPRTYGFRFSVVDFCALVAAAVGANLVWPMSAIVAFMIAMVVGHFFLFCNVFRIRRNLELTWAALFVVNCGAWWVWLADDRVLPVFLTQLPITLSVLLFELRAARYHGIFARRINPRLDEYLRGILPI